MKHNLYTFLFTSNMHFEVCPAFLWHIYIFWHIHDKVWRLLMLESQFCVKKWHFSCNSMQWSGKRNDFLTMWQLRDSVMQISISVMLKRDFSGNLYKYIRVWQDYIIHCGPSIQQVKTTLYSTFSFIPCSFTILWIAINGLSLCLDWGTELENFVSAFIV